MNQLILSGRLGNQPTFKTVKGDTKIAQVSVATTARIKSKTGEWTDLTKWVPVTFFGKQAEYVVNRAEKGTKVFIVASVEQRSWEKDGKKHYDISIVGQSIDLTPKAEATTKETSWDAEVPASSSFNDEDIPF